MSRPRCAFPLRASVALLASIPLTKARPMVESRVKWEDPREGTDTGPFCDLSYRRAQLVTYFGFPL